MGRMTTTIRILLIDDHAMFRSGLRMLLNLSMPCAEIVEANSLNEVLSGTLTSMDIVLLDLKMNGLNGLEGIALLKQKWPLTLILVLSAQDEAETVRIALARGAARFVSKAETAEKITESIKLVLGGQFATSPGVESNLPNLTKRQFEVLKLLDQGLSNKLIARQLELSENTVRRHVQDILLYFQKSSRAEAVFAARSKGLVN